MKKETIGQIIIEGAVGFALVTALVWLCHMLSYVFPGWGVK